MSAERQEIQFTPVEEQRIDCVASSLLEQGEGAIDRLRNTRHSYEFLGYTILLEGGSIRDAHAAGGRTVEMANEAINRAQEELEKRGEDRISQLKKIAEEIIR